MENILKQILVGDLLKQLDGKTLYNFFIPSYQRGYRWNEEQVTDLLEDFYEFIITDKSTTDKYCLQPIVVKKTKDNKYEVLDGQQRLTTIYILLTRLKKSNSEIDLFSLEYETRPNSTVFLQKELNGEINNDNPDYYYISKAYKTIDTWLKDTKLKKANISTKIYDAICESIEFIWYEIVKDTDPIDVFTRINIGKIPLTNSELVKAVFLSKNNLSIGALNKGDDSFDKIISLKQNAISLEWNEIEKKLQDPKIWGFISGNLSKYETRIDYILDLVSNKSNGEQNKYYAFKHFYDKVKEARLTEKNLNNNKLFIEEEWDNLKNIFDVLLEWYDEKEYNHLIGYLINQNHNILDLISKFKKNDRESFKKSLKEQIKEDLNLNDISNLRYNNTRDKEKINKTLLLHNIINSLKIEDQNIHFPFDKIKNKKWTLEHIFAQNSESLREKDYNNWLKDHIHIVKEKTKLSDLYLNKTITKEKFEQLFNYVAEYNRKKLENIDPKKDSTNWLNDDHSIANLALLDGSMNSSIKNSLFDIKRSLILDKEKKGLFIPNETKKVFLKYYTPKPEHLSYWTFIDRKSYVEDIKLTLTYLN